MGMTREEFSMIVKGMKSVYAYQNFIADKDAFDMWYALLGDLDYKTASEATKEYMMTETRIPTPADIRNKVVNYATRDELTDSEAWALVSKALRNSAYDSKEQFNALPPLAQRAVGSPEILYVMATSEGYNESVESSNFKKTYRALQERSHEEIKIDLSKLIGGNDERRRIEKQDY